MITAFRIKIFEMPGYEADDIIGTIARTAASEGSDVSIVTADKDMMQLIDDRVKIYDPVKDRILDRTYVFEKFGIGPERVTEYMALTGDAVDNIPGIKGIGDNTAKELLLTFPSLHELLDHPERIGREKLRTMIVNNRELVLLRRKLATIDTAVPIRFAISDFVLGEPDWLSLLSLFKEFEFTSLMKLLPSEGLTVFSGDRRHETVFAPDRLREISSMVSAEFALDTETTGKDPMCADLVGLAVCLECARGCGRGRPALGHCARGDERGGSVG